MADKRALVVLDLMPRIVGRALAPHSGDDVLEQCRRLATAFRRRGDPVILVRTERPRLGGQPAGSGLCSNLERRGDVVLVKRSIGAFATTNLDLVLKVRGISTVVIGGITTGMSVESTARTAVDLGYAVEFVEDAMTGLTVDEHRWAISNVFPRLGSVADVSRYEAGAGSRVPQGWRT